MDYLRRALHRLSCFSDKERKPVSSEPCISIVATGSEYPPHRVDTEIIAKMAQVHFPPSPALEKTVALCKLSGIQERYVATPPEKLLAPRDSMPTIADCDRDWKEYGIPLAVKASQKALACWGGSSSDITHIIAVTCTNSSHPGFDAAVSTQLNLPRTVHRTLLHGVGCAGGSAALRTAYELLLSATARGQKGRALVVACEITSVFALAELAHASNSGQISPAVALFADCSSALVLSNGIGTSEKERPPVWDVLNVRSELIEGSEGTLEYTISPTGYIATIAKSIPGFVQASLPETFRQLINSTPQLVSDPTRLDVTSYDWALHPGGLKIISTAQEVLGITEHHLRKTYDVYRSRGNTSSSTVLSIMDRFRGDIDATDKGREKMVAVAFGPGMTIEMAVLRRSRMED